ncbi:hypothetical protein EVAR_68285_1 [Eumeta japonica]|uniref:Uncharacterized protein n=1 Tax=Eumeta variegata TaxID=151549 RepID=A0A4C1ZRV1_EUMVA|nr:hypothetical protein EVAR_68285_1 [Eumeta japonica]
MFLRKQVAKERLSSDLIWEVFFVSTYRTLKLLTHVYKLQKKRESLFKILFQFDLSKKGMETLEFDTDLTLKNTSRNERGRLRPAASGTNALILFALSGNLSSTRRATRPAHLPRPHNRSCHLML